jgi:hypothetical protein
MALACVEHVRVRPGVMAAASNTAECVCVVFALQLGTAGSNTVVREVIDYSSLLKVMSAIHRGVAVNWEEARRYWVDHPITNAELLAELTVAWPPFLSVSSTVLVVAVLL